MKFIKVLLFFAIAILFSSCSKYYDSWSEEFFPIEIRVNQIQDYDDEMKAIDFELLKSDKPFGAISDNTVLSKEEMKLVIYDSDDYLLKEGDIVKCRVEIEDSFWDFETFQLYFKAWFTSKHNFEILSISNLKKIYEQNGYLANNALSESQKSKYDWEQKVDSTLSGTGDFFEENPLVMWGIVALLLVLYIIYKRKKKSKVNSENEKSE